MRAVRFLNLVKAGAVLALVAAVTLAAAGPARAELLCGWNFNNNTAGSPSSNAGILNATGALEVYSPGTKTIAPASWGTKSASSAVDLSNLAGTMGGTPNDNWGTFAGDIMNKYDGDIAGGALAVIGYGNENKYVQFDVPTVGYQDIVLSYATRGTSTGFTTHTWSYSTDGINYTAVTPITGRNVTTWSAQTIDFSSVTALDNQASAHFRVTFTGASSTSTNGNNRIDNVQFNGTAVPEPGTLVLLLGGAVCALGAVVFRRRK